ncbi:fructose-bisphosphate aldolase class-I-domain-containing protein [Tribonema minus]|uniref:fructose-bisphosphate aldolase n=1 Tax=Tribonema minus TaxID=303371 RepID=A0A835Z9U9_9STRA|nr:fructose-bisphosphate aldolase class-I-domain-containing protein [Tribonema minus]
MSSSVVTTGAVLVAAGAAGAATAFLTTTLRQQQKGVVATDTPPAIAVAAAEASLSKGPTLGEATAQHLREALEVAKQLTGEQKAELEAIAQQLTAPGKGVLAADESVSTIGKRLVKAGLQNDFETRRGYREVLLSHPDLGQYLAGAILHEETLDQVHSDGRTFVQVLSDKGVLVGVKTDRGLQPLIQSPTETQTLGMGDLLERSRRYRAKGARFAKWRAVLRLDAAAGTPTDAALALNAAQLAQYAALSQASAAGLVPIVEPELLIEGTHSAAEFAACTEVILGEVYAALAKAQVHLEGTLLKPQMAMAGIGAPSKHTREELVALTLAALRRRVPPAVPGVVFLSGGQSEEEATGNLNAIARAAGVGVAGAEGEALRRRHPWSLSFSFGRSLQASVLQVWSSGGGAAAAIDIAGALAKANAQAQQGAYEGPHPSLTGAASLHDPNRGWQGPPAAAAAAAAAPPAPDTVKGAEQATPLS